MADRVYKQLLSITYRQKERCRPFYRIHEEPRMNPVTPHRLAHTKV